METLIYVRNNAMVGRKMNGLRENEDILMNWIWDVTEKDKSWVTLRFLDWASGWTMYGTIYWEGEDLEEGWATKNTIAGMVHLRCLWAIKMGISGR